jgi:hypothetical protein
MDSKSETTIERSELKENETSNETVLMLGTSYIVAILFLRVDFR